jgi:hypothetical protein
MSSAEHRLFTRGLDTTLSLRKNASPVPTSSLKAFVRPFGPDRRHRTAFIRPPDTTPIRRGLVSQTVRLPHQPGYFTRPQGELFLRSPKSLPGTNGHRKITPTIALISSIYFHKMYGVENLHEIFGLKAQSRDKVGLMAFRTAVSGFPRNKTSDVSWDHSFTILGCCRL